MSINAGARIVPLAVANHALHKRMGPQVEVPSDEYARVHLLSRDGSEKLVRITFSVGGVGERFHEMKYGVNAKDFPLCTDYAKVALGLMVLQSALLGLTVRPMVYRLHYTQNALDELGRHKRHAANGFVLEDESVLDFEPNGLRFLDAPWDLKKYDRVRL